MDEELLPQVLNIPVERKVFNYIEIQFSTFAFEDKRPLKDLGWQYRPYKRWCKGCVTR